MMRSSLYLMSNSGLQAGFGFTFWIVTAHLFTAEDIGRASALTAATTVIAYLALLGLNNALGKYLPTASNRDAIISGALVLVAICGGSIALCYIFLAPFIAPGLSFVAQRPILAVGFAFMTAAATLNILTDSVFVASRKAAYTTFVDGIVAGVGKLVLAFVLAGTGAYGVFLASATGTALAAAASLGLIYVVMRTRLMVGGAFESLRPLLRFSSANYVGNVLNMLPTLIVPLIVLDRLGAAAAAYYFVVYQVVSILYAAALAIEQTLLAEGSQESANLSRLKRRSLSILVMLCAPAAIGLAAVGHWILLAFGEKYYRNGLPSLLLLTLAAGPVTTIYWCLTVLRLAGKLRSIVLVNGIYAASVCVLAWFGAAHGLTMLTAAWPVGATIGAIAAATSLPRKKILWARRSLQEAVKLSSHANTDVKPAPRAGQGSGEWTTRRSSPNRKWWLCGTTVTLVLATTGCLVSPDIRHELALSLWRQHTSYTELGFNGAAQLPRVGVRGRTISFSFAVTNDGSDPAFYQYLIASGSGKHLKPLAVASERLTPGQVWDVNESIVPRCRRDACKIRVSLPKEREAIDFTVNLARAR